LFAWTALVADFRVATGIWAAVIVASVALCVVQISRLRHASGFSELPMAVMLALVLWSAPVVFAMERGNFDVLVLACMLLAAWALARPSPGLAGHLLAALCFVVAATIKVYPLAVLLALFAMRQYRVLALTAAGTVILVLALAEPFSEWLAVLRTLPGAGPRVNPLLDFWQFLTGGAITVSAGGGDFLYFLDNIPTWASLHSPGDVLPALWFRLGLEPLAAWPVLAMNFFVLAPITLWGYWRIDRLQDAQRFSLPVLLWIMAVATYWMPFSYDYNLIFLPLLIIATWDSREPPLMQILLAMSVPWWLPFGPAGPADFDLVVARVVLKLVALYVATALLVRSFAR
jgi:hypothetical protein